MRGALLIAGSWWWRLSLASLLALAFQVCVADAPRADSVAPSAGVAAPATLALPAPPEVAAALPAARLRGRGALHWLGLSVYEARLWAGADFAAARYADHVFALELQYARKLSGAAIAQRSIGEMRRAGGFDDGQAQAWQAAMTRGFPDVAPGDRLTGVHLPGEATHFFHNGRPTATLADPAFGRLLFGIWLAATTSEPELRRHLIGPDS